MTKDEFAEKLAKKCDLSKAKANDIIDAIFSTRAKEGIIATELDAGRPFLITGFGGCNAYTASFSLGEANPLVMTIGSVMATQRSCANPIASQETAYFTALPNVSHWGYVFGKLGLFYDDGQDELGRLLFAPVVK